MRLVELTGRALGAVSAASIGLLWAFAIGFPKSGIGLAGASVAVAWLMAVIAIVGIIAAVKGHSAVLFGVFVASFLPVGAYLLYVTAWPRWIGVLDCALLAAAIMIRQGRRAAVAQP